MTNAKIIKDIAEAINQSQKGTSAYDTTAEVVRVEGSTAWVHIPGGVDETPVTMSITAKPGDTVRVRVSGGQAWTMGNDSNPPTDDTTAVAAQKTADIALKDAERAEAAADSAEASASAAATAASAAVTAADSAQASADNANEYAARALGNLSTVQSVTETLTWITNHGTMALTTDTALDPTHVYFIADASGDYTVGGATYSVVVDPDVADIATYYELTIDESLNNYVGTHLALTSEGLWLIPEASGGYKILIATGSGTTYTEAGTYILDASGETVAFFGETVQIGKADESNLQMDYHSMQMVDKEGNTYFYVSDLRDEEGFYVAEESYEYYYTGGIVGEISSVEVVYDIYDVSEITFGGTAVSESEYSFSGNTITFNPVLYIFADSTLAITYTTQAEDVKAYTLGVRASGTIGANSVAEGSGIIASGRYSHAEGNATAANGEASHAEGSGSAASGKAAHSEGASYAQADYSHAEGAASYAHAEASHAEGSGSVANGSAAHAEGNTARAYGANSHAEGNATYCDTAAPNSHAQNLGTTAYSANQTVMGRYNEWDSAGIYALIVGNGTANASGSRSNAAALKWDGDIELALDTSASSGTTDDDLYAAITALSWQSEVIV